MTALGGDWRSIGWTLVRWTVASVFIYAGCLKLGAANQFAASISRFRIAPEFLINPLALGLPPLEILCGTALVIGRWKRQAALGLVLLCTLFVAAFVQAGVRGISVDCTCFGASAAEPMWIVILRDVVLLAASLAIYVQHISGGHSFAHQPNEHIGALNETY